MAACLSTRVTLTTKVHPNLAATHSTYRSNNAWTGKDWRQVDQVAQVGPHRWPRLRQLDERQKDQLAEGPFG
jgi:hypothetical protein|tara:strand:+ start:335 stop:550 length:216 start_codon:yes stop_codon:yes gene_type:complete